MKLLAVLPIASNEADHADPRHRSMGFLADLSVGSNESALGNFGGMSGIDGGAEASVDLLGCAVAHIDNFGRLNKRCKYLFHGVIAVCDEIDKLLFDLFWDKSGI